jgi:hypothetical protein
MKYEFFMPVVLIAAVPAVRTRGVPWITRYSRSARDFVTGNRTQFSAIAATVFIVLPSLVRIRRMLAIEPPRIYQLFKGDVVHTSEYFHNR